MPHKTSLVWFRRALRVTDNRALRTALAASESVVPVFVIDPAILKRPDTGERRVAFLWAGLRALDTELRQRGSALIVRCGEPAQELARLAEETGATALYYGQEYEPAGKARDQRVVEALRNLESVACRDHLLAEPESLATKAGTPYTVFTPYFRLWQEQAFLAPVAAPERIPTPQGIASEPLPESVSVLPAGERAAQEQLQGFARAALRAYDTERDFPALPGTSQLSAYLKLGMLSPRQALGAARQCREQLPVDRRAGVDAWVRQLAWRDFYYQILVHFPHVATGSFKPKFDALAWPNDPTLYAAWERGETGYPIVDAGMRQLAQTGTLHNRVRMIVASFLTKDLLCDWRLGERYFMQQLLDGDQAANNGGWQWAAGTGTDAQPYFRIFNPVSQGEKFDPDAQYVKLWCPELKRVPAKWAHKPWELSRNEQAAVNCVLGKDYPQRIVEHSEQRARALALYKMVAKEDEE
ncbi:cryptochrome/photolyase family protein [Armatimonas rosea]|uniref:Deoxyribodipyrimidine photo-lyase n=1 Tax=Armatimonas rosea TaxID=685828 RepID=A0A7W9SST3_ARMRO|nr:deoxyribodipyrimidine photo-lyase [Armatimonas rosea]MBB6052056.1 deoxyribodipyrimidine photo-lyase [Armatimonas rosea]